MPVFAGKAIRAEIMNTRQMQGAVQAALNAVAKSTEADIKTITATWNDKPVIHVKTHRKGGDLYVIVRVISNKYNWLDFGTKRRYVVMTKDFIPKTTPGSFMSRPGQGGVARRLSSRQHPRPGIKARNWSIDLSAKAQWMLEDNVSWAIRKYLRP